MTLTSTRKRVDDITEEEFDRMHALMDQHYEGVTPEQFKQDLYEKEEVVLLSNGSIQGFSTIMKLQAERDGKNIQGIFSGDTIIHPSCWGSQELVREVGSYMIENMSTEHESYWLLISKGYKTFKYLPLFFKNYYPHPDHESSKELAAIRDLLATQKFGTDYDASQGLVRFAAPERLRPGVADISEQRLRADRHAQLFQELNPNWAQGDELVCLAPIRPDNFTSLGYRIITSQAKQSYQ